MSILKRVISMTKAAANEALDKIENPVIMLNHYLRDLDEEIAKAERAEAQQQVQERMLLAKLDELNGQAVHYEGKAVQAAAEEREAETRAALEAKLLYKEQAEETARLLQMAKQAVLELGQRVASLKEERTRLQAKRAELIARVRKSSGPSGFAPAQSLQGSSAARGFERIEQKVMEWEAARELSGASYGVYGDSAQSAASTDLKQERRSALVEEELQRLLKK